MTTARTLRSIIATSIFVMLIAAVGIRPASASSHPPGYWNLNVCKPLYLAANLDRSARARESCAKNVTLHVYVNGHSQILIAEQFGRTATFYGNECIVRIRSVRGVQSVLAVTTSFRVAHIRVRFTPDWKLG